MTRDLLPFAAHLDESVRGDDAVRAMFTLEQNVIGVLVGCHSRIAVHAHLKLRCTWPGSDTNFLDLWVTKSSKAVRLARVPTDESVLRSQIHPADATLGLPYSLRECRVLARDRAQAW